MPGRCNLLWISCIKDRDKKDIMTQFDQWPAMQDFTFQEFSFKGSNYEMWEAGRKIHSGVFNVIIHCICNGGVYNRTSIDVNISGNLLPEILSSKMRFDRAICLGERIMFYSTPVTTNVQNTTLAMLSNIVGYTQQQKYYENNEPVVASVFTINQSVVKMSFSLASPDRRIEVF